MQEAFLRKRGNILGNTLTLNQLWYPSVRKSKLASLCVKRVWYLLPSVLSVGEEQV